MSASRALTGLDILTPDEPGMVGAITSFRFQSRISAEENQRIVEELRTRYGLFTAVRTGLARGACVRITPALYNSAADVDRLAVALKELSRLPD